MKPIPTSTGALPRYLLASLLLSSFPALAQSIPNPSFETDTFPNGVGYISANTPITGWTGSPTNRVGLNPSSSSPFADNGLIPEGAKVAFIQGASTGPSTLSTTITGLTPGTTYHVGFRATTRSNSPVADNPAGNSYPGNAPFLNFSTNGTGLSVSAQVQRVQPTNALPKLPYRFLGYDFTATASSHVMTLTNAKLADHTVVVDDFKIAASTGAWATKAWTGDQPEFFDAAYPYTHAYNFNGGYLNINNVPFVGTGLGQPGFFLTGFTKVHLGPGAADNLVTGTSKLLATPFFYDGSPSITVQNLKPNTQYVASIYGIGWDAQTPTPYHRAATFSSSLGGEHHTVNLNQFGRGNGLIVEYRYTTDATGTPVTISYPPLSPSAGTFHTAGFSNREAIASTPANQWVTASWNEDESSGLSPNHLYTHAFKFGAATNFNVNGVNFTGVAGANPGGSGLTTSGLPNTYLGDDNEVTGYSTPLARDFVYGGFPTNYNLSGLTPGQSYVFTLYSVGWSDGLREAVLTGPGSGRETHNQTEFGDNGGIRFEYTYTAPATGVANFSLFGRDGVKSIHNYGMSNREADAFVNKGPEMTLHPTGGEVAVGATFALHSEAIGSAGMTYQWKKGVNDVPGGNSPVLTLEDFGPGHVGSYTLVITNDFGSVTSDPAILTLTDNVPNDLSTGMGYDGQPLAAGQIDPTFKIISNPDNPESETAYVQSNVPTAWIANSTTSKWIGPRVDTALAAGAPALDTEVAGTYVYRTTLDLTNFDLSTVKVTGRWSSDNIGTEIRVNGTPVGFANTVGNTFAAYVPFAINNGAFPGLLTGGVNTFDFVVNNATNGFTGLRLDGFTATGNLPPNTPPHIAVQPASITATHRLPVVLGVGVSASSPITYQWYKGTDPIPDETLPYLSVPIEDLTAGGSFKVRVTSGTSVDSDIAVVTVGNAIPVVVPDLLATPKDTPRGIAPSLDLIDDDTDPDNDPVFFNGFMAETAEGGTVTQFEDELTYTPPDGFEGVDTFTYTVNDGLWGGISAPGTVSITVGNAAAAVPVNLTLAFVGGDVVTSFTGSPGSSYTLQRSLTLGNDWTDVDTDTAAAVTGAVALTDPDPPAGKAFYRISYVVP
ncbi:Ig-like domain-containing protein [Luteolibacter sp. Populi]|uniref:Ig-like domain-containing protein n=1 Tax=Luteolibacter sp. Populi TaxID=3230487 RepID=UPI0034650A04